MEQTDDPLSAGKDSEEKKKKDVLRKEDIEKRALSEYIELCKRYPLRKGYRKGIRKELEKLAIKYPGVRFPGFSKLTIGTNEDEINLSVKAAKLQTEIEAKLHKHYFRLTLSRSAIKVLSYLNQTSPTTRKETLENTGLSNTNLIRTISLLKDMRLIHSWLRGKYHHYAITKEGKEFLEGL